MEAPKCKFCGERHWGQCPSLAATPAKSRDQNAEKPAKAQKSETGPSSSTKSTAERVKRWRSENRERYNESMRAYRAKKKADKT